MNPGLAIRGESQPPMKVVVVAKGLYVVRNYYGTDYEYFKGRKLPKC